MPEFAAGAGSAHAPCTTWPAKSDAAEAIARADRRTGARPRSGRTARGRRPAAARPGRGDRARRRPARRAPRPMPSAALRAAGWASPRTRPASPPPPSRTWAELHAEPAPQRLPLPPQAKRAARLAGAGAVPDDAAPARAVAVGRAGLAAWSAWSRPLPTAGPAVPRRPLRSAAAQRSLPALRHARRRWSTARSMPARWSRSGATQLPRARHQRRQRDRLAAVVGQRAAAGAAPAPAGRRRC